MGVAVVWSRTTSANPRCGGSRAGARCSIGGTIAVSMAILLLALTQVRAQDLPAIPAIDDLVRIPSHHLAAGYVSLAGITTYSEQAIEAGFNQVRISIDQKPYVITRENGDAFMGALRERLEVYRAAIERRGADEVAGQYLVNANQNCQGERLDLRSFLAEEVAGRPIMPSRLVLRQQAHRADLVFQVKRNGRQRDVVYSGIVVESSLVFAAPANLGFNLWGTVGDSGIELRLDVKELQEAIGTNVASLSDWERFKKCVFTLAPVR